MIILLHGDHIEASRGELNRLRESAVNKDVRVLDGRTVEESHLIQSLESSSLFGGETLIIIERLFGKISKQPKRIEALCHILIRASATANIVLWEDKEVGTTVLKHLGTGVTNKIFKLPVLIFQFLDSVRPNNRAASLTLYQQLVSIEPAELVFSMFVKRVRHLIQLADNVTPSGLAGWQANRLTTQAKSFTMEKLIDLYRQLHDIEVSIKTGMSPFSISDHLELVIASL